MSHTPHTLQIEGNAMSFAKLFRAALMTSALLGCVENPNVKTPNDAPLAKAEIVGSAGAVVDKKAADDVRTFALNGAASVEVQLVGDGSTDDHDDIVRYRWLSAASAEPGTRRIPEGQAADWPPDEARPKVTLTEGTWMFTLWVEDGEGVVSLPDTITVIAGAPTPPDMGAAGAAAPPDPAAVMMCADQVVDGVARPCAECLCGIESCRPMVMESGCDATCWALIQCIGANCPDFAAMAATMDYSCLTTNCMAEYTASMGGTTPMGATPAGACARMCPDDCAAM
jgi:hypothetical protein